MLAGLPDVTAHFGRFRVTEISLSTAALAQFDLQPILDAALLLADAKGVTVDFFGDPRFESDLRQAGQQQQGFVLIHGLALTLGRRGGPDRSGKTTEILDFRAVSAHRGRARGKAGRIRRPRHARPAGARPFPHPPPSAHSAGLESD